MSSIKEFMYNNSRADPMPHSAGLKKSRLDLAYFLQDESFSDPSSHLLVAVQKPLAKEGELKGGLRGTVVKTEQGKELALNTASLAKRLGVSRGELSRAEKKGKVSELIKEKLQALQKNQQLLNGLLEGDEVEFESDTERELSSFVKKQIPDRAARKLARSLIKGEKLQPKEQLTLRARLWWQGRCAVSRAPEGLQVEEGRLKEAPLQFRSATFGDFFFRRSKTSIGVSYCNTFRGLLLRRSSTSSKSA